MLNNKILRVLSLLCVVACLMFLFGCSKEKTNDAIVTFPEDVVKRILEPVIDVIVDAIDIEKQQLKNDLISLVKGDTDEKGDRS